MARMTFMKGEEFSLQLRRFSGQQADGVVKKSLYAGAKVMTDAIKTELRSVVSEKATGALEDSLGIAPMQINRNGNWDTKIGFDGYDQKGAPNQLKARALESGTSTIQKRPFVRPAVRKSRKKAEEVMRATYNAEIQKLIGGN